MSDKELEAVASLLWVIYAGKHGYSGNLSFYDELTPEQREAWIRVARYVSAYAIDVEERAMYGVIRGHSAVQSLLDEYATL